MSKANADQATFWNAQPGQNWVTYQAELDAQLTEVTERLLAACAVAPGERVLDIGCGAGGSTLALAEAVGLAGSVVGLDLSEPLLARAEERRRAAGLDPGQVRFERGDAQDFPFAPGSFDLAASRFGVMFFADPVAAFRNVARGIAPGGRVVFVAWAGPEHNPWFTIPQQAAVARLGPVEPVPPDAPGPMAFRDTERVLGLLAAAGLRDARAETVDLGLHNPGGLDAVMELVGCIGSLPRVLRERGGTAEDRAAILAEVRKHAAAFVTPAGLRLPARVIFYSARV
jgi:SAM-dependent methyltransferase